MPDAAFWRGRRVFLTGHTGFKGSWLSLWLHTMGAEVTGYALDPPTNPSLYVLCGINQLVDSVIADVREAQRLAQELRRCRPEVVFHLAARPIVRDSYRIPVETYATNVMGTVHLLEAVRTTPGVRALVVVSSDKCYANHEWVWGYREDEPLGGHDPYSSSKACAELVTAAYRSSYFLPDDYPRHGVAVATARAGNVFGGGDWAADRLVPDWVRASLLREPVEIRSPYAIRPWQHVLEPLAGYLLLAKRLCAEGPRFCGAWNFGPSPEGEQTVEWLVERFCTAWGADAAWRVGAGEHPHEDTFLKLDCSKARALLGWRPRWSLLQAVEATVAWTRTYRDQGDLRAVCLQQIDTYARGMEPA
jgi:CDP-glucose 4,6-dehydratase